MQVNIVMSDREEIYLGEKEFGERMKQEVEPFLKKYRRYAYFSGYDGTPLFYYAYQLPQAKACVIISHGFCEFAKKYNEVVYYFLRNGYSVYLPEHRGHGYSGRKLKDIDKVHVESFQEYVEDLHIFLEETAAAEQTKKVLYAHSMGGAIAAMYLERYSDDFDAAILSSPMFRMKTGRYPAIVAKVTTNFYNAVGKGERYAAGQREFEEHPEDDCGNCVSRERYAYIFDKRLKDMQYHTSGGTYAWVSAAMKAEKVLMKKENLNRIRTPILLFEAGEDRLVDNMAIERFARQTGQTELIRMPDSRHEIYNAGDTERKNYYDRMFEFLESAADWSMTSEESEQKKEKNKDERKAGKTGKILGII